jgi:flavin-binding protein dodecin
MSRRRIPHRFLARAKPDDDISRSPGGRQFESEASMSVARYQDYRGSTKGFQDAVQTGLARAAKTLRGITGLEVLSQRAKVEDGRSPKTASPWR